MLLHALAAAPVQAAGRHAAPTRAHADARHTRAQLESVRGQIARVARQVSRGQAERDRLTRQLKDTEKSVGKAQAALEDLRQQRQSGAARRAQLETQKQQLETDLTSSRGALAGQLRAAYLIGRQEPLKLLLNQEDPARAGRMFVYYSYFGRARAARIEAIQGDLQR
ncbi:MAG: murein hydrolase activator EnvC family protein, partial [Steroidobacteraceae bacterium]